MYVFNFITRVCRELNVLLITKEPLLDSGSFLQVLGWTSLSPSAIRWVHKLARQELHQYFPYTDFALLKHIYYIHLSHHTVTLTIWH